MAFNISEFNATLNKHGLAKSNLFVVTIQMGGNMKLANDLAEASKMDTRTLTFLCKSAEMPAIEVQTADFKPRGYGPSEKRPTGFELPILPTVFMVDSNFGVLKFFHRWMQTIVNYDVDGGYSSEVNGGQRPYEFGYRDEYACTIEVTIYSQNQTDKTYTYKFYNAYPTNVGSVQVSWENQAEVMNLPVQFAYDAVKVEATTTGKVTGDFGSPNGILSFLSSINTFGQALNNLNRPRNLQDVINTVTDVNTILGALK
jgi:hypothetical protein